MGPGPATGAAAPGGLGVNVSVELYMILLTVLAVGFGLLEYRAHVSRLKSIRIRIHVNGTRGKSSVTRLIAAGLRAGGLRTFAKTTGTLPRMIMNDGQEFPVYRPAKANIIEQLRIVSLAASERADALVIECMALQPALQSMTELKIVRATIGVITNARADHLDVMGPEEKDVALALLGSTPVKGVLCTAERDYLPLFREACADRGSELGAVTLEDIAGISDADMAGFSYREHKENVALALQVCERAGVARDVALQGMWTAQPDPGAMKEHHVEFFGRDIMFINGFAANDPESSEMIWDMALEKHASYPTRIILVNCRADRADRSRQIGEVVPHWRRADYYVAMGSGTYVFMRAAAEHGLAASQLVYAEGMSTDRLFETILGLCGHRTMIMGLGNIGGGGLELAAYFRNRRVLDEGDVAPVATPPEGGAKDKSEASAASAA